MSYVKTTWQDGDLITASKMNHIEEGIEDAEGKTVSWDDVTDKPMTFSGNDVTFPGKVKAGASPTLSSDLTTKAYVDSKTGGINYNVYAMRLIYDHGAQAWRTGVTFETISGIMQNLGELFDTSKKLKGDIVALVLDNNYVDINPTVGHRVYHLDYIDGYSLGSATLTFGFSMRKYDNGTMTLSVLKLTCKNDVYPTAANVTAEINDYTI